MKKYRIAVVGVGLVGSEILRILQQRNFPAESIKVLARRKRTEVIDKIKYEVVPTTVDAFDDIDIALFAGTEGAKGASQLYGWEAVKKGVIVIDNGQDFRMDPRVPLVVPEINAEDLKNHQGFIANPNCSTIQMVMAMAPLHKISKIKRVVVSTYQAVSGTGNAALRELEQQVKDYVAGNTLKADKYPHQIFSNVLPHIGSIKKDEAPGYYSEEIKMVKETQKIFGTEDIKVTATCVRAPVFNSHSETVNIEFEDEISVEKAKDALNNFPGVTVVDDPENTLYPLPIDATGKDDVFVGRIRKDFSTLHALNLWVVSDNIRKGAALNAVQIAERMIVMGLI